MKLSLLAVWIVHRWREIVATPWIWLGSLIDIHVPPRLAFLLSLYVFIILFMTRSILRSRHSNIEKSEFMTIMSCLFLFIFLVFTPWLISGAFIHADVAILLAIVTMSWIAFWFGGSRSAALTLAIFIAFYIFIFSILPGLYFWGFDILTIIFGSILCIKTGLAVREAGDRKRILAIWHIGAINAVRATLLVSGIVCMNWIGVYAPNIKAWIDKTTSLSP